MGDIGEVFKELRDRRKDMRAKYGISCPNCNILQPKRIATILLPQQKCKVCGYKDTRPRIEHDS